MPDEQHLQDAIREAVEACKDYAEARKYLPSETNDLTEVLDKRRRDAINYARSVLKGGRK